MAGKDHHHVWRMLQRGFGEKRGSDYHVWIYTKNKMPKQSGTGNFGVEKYFYGPENSETDKKITDFENSVQGEILEARERPDGYELDAKWVAPLIAHLEVRSQFLRSELSNLMGRLTDSLNHHFSSTEKIRAVLKSYLKNHPDKLETFLDKNLVPKDRRVQASHLIDLYIDMLPAEVIEEHINGEFSVVLSQLLQITGTIKDAHNEAILSITSDNPRIMALREFTFCVYRPIEGQLILPDTCCAFFGENKVAPFSQQKDDFQVVIIPISSNVAILGRKGRSEGLGITRINRILAGCAYDAFIANMDNKQYVSLTSRIGKHAKLISEKEIKNMLSLEKLLSV